MMLIKTITLIAFFLVSPSSSQLIKSQYKWDENVQFCSFTLHIFFNIVCENGFNDGAIEDVRFKYKLGEYQSLSIDCCQQTCTPLHILKHHCVSSKSVDTSKDLITFPTKQQIGNTAPINTYHFKNLENITITEIMDYFMGFKQFLSIGLQQANFRYELYNYKFEQ